MKVHKMARCKKNLLQREQLEKIPLLLYRQPMWANKALFSMTEGFLSNFRFNLETSLLNSPNCHEWWRKDWRLLPSLLPCSRVRSHGSLCGGEERKQLLISGYWHQPGYPRHIWFQVSIPVFSEDDTGHHIYTEPPPGELMYPDPQLTFVWYLPW